MFPLSYFTLNLTVLSTCKKKEEQIAKSDISSALECTAQSNINHEALSFGSNEHVKYSD